MGKRRTAMNDCPSVALFFSPGVSLRAWDEMGLFEREVALYRSLQARGVDVAFVTYGDSHDLTYGDRLLGIKIMCNAIGLPGKIYRALIPLIHLRGLKAYDVLKSNQMRGADEALRAAKLAKKPLIVRCGYMWSDLAANRVPQRRGEYARAKRTERRVFPRAGHIAVTTPSMANYVSENYHVSVEKIRIVPNYVLDDLFSPSETAVDGDSICFIGRLHPDKNPLALVEACSGLDVELQMVGDGPMRSDIIQAAKRDGTNLKLRGSVPYLQLPQILRSSAMFALVSPHEGHPKTLIEAMSCGLAVIGADSPGIREQIVHGETGWLCGTDARSIREAILYLRDRPALQARLGRNARRFVEQNYTLDRIVGLELALLNEVAGT